MGKKNLEQVFKETFIDFQDIPEDKVWQSIEASLDKKEKKRILPIWWKLGGVAAVLAILFYIINPFGGIDDNSQIIITNTETKDTIEKKDSTEKGGLENELKLEVNNEQELTEIKKDDNKGDPVENSSSNTQNDAANSLNKNQSIKVNEQITETSTNQKRQDFEKDNTLKNKKAGAVAFTDNPDVKKTKVEENPAGFTPDKNKSTSIASVDESEKNESSTDIPQNKKLKSGVSIENTTQEDAVAQVEEKEEKGKEEEEIVEKKSIFDVIEEQEQEAVVENTKRKWSIGPSVAPVYFSATGEGSPIHSNFSSNPKSGNVNLSYGLTVAYDIGKKLKVRSGIHKVDFGYETNNISASSSLEGSTNALIDNIDYNLTSRNLVLDNKSSASNSLASRDPIAAEFSDNVNPAVDGSLVQQLGYIEVPFELSYAIVDKKLGVNIIGGVSSLFLLDGNNSISVEADNLVTEVGEANNANSINFSTNVGVGLNYEFSPKVQFNIEPVFKYQLNTFSETAGTFRPFAVGVYSGISFRF